MKTRPDLAPDETVLWEGRPDPSMRFGIEAIALGGFGLLIVGGAAGFAAMLGDAVPGAMWILTGPAILIAIAIFFFFPLVQSYHMRRQSYMLTNKRAYLIGYHPGVQLAGDREGFPIPPADKIILKGDNVYFAKRPAHRHATESRNTRIFHDTGFVRIPDAQAVYDLMIAHAPKDDSQ